MAARLLAHDVSDLCLGKPSITSLPISATIHDALNELKSSEDTHISIWNCTHNHLVVSDDQLISECRCVGKICMVDIICYLCKEDNISDPSTALKSPVSVLMSHGPGVIQHVEPSFRYNRSSSYSARMMRRSEAIVCYPGSSLVAVMIQAIAHRVSYVWVIEEDCSVVGIVRFCGMLEVFREHLERMIN
ncbi:Cystathionine beta-synthase, core [Artemisia annua]|uniref:Cystathionine beta-synthase, core n=1 Tax=Artemisia annua TaxID=35608 RepID=A0A2U1KRT4_ARTAN|nr:Cystathionine beta-synthase, core [Artemisia annua]